MCTVSSLWSFPSLSNLTTIKTNDCVMIDK